MVLQISSEDLYCSGYGACHECAMQGKIVFLLRRKESLAMENREGEVGYVQNIGPAAKSPRLYRLVDMRRIGIAAHCQRQCLERIPEIINRNAAPLLVTPPMVDPLALLQSTLVAAGVWNKLTVMYFGPQFNAVGAVQNLKNPGTFDLVPTNNPSFTPNRGFTGDGATTSLVGATFTAMAAAGLFSVNDMSAGIFSLNSAQAASIAIGGTDTASQPFGFQSADSSRSAGMRSGTTTTDLIPAANSGVCHWHGRARMRVAIQRTSTA